MSVRLMTGGGAFAWCLLLLGFLLSFGGLAAMVTLAAGQGDVSYGDPLALLVALALLVGLCAAVCGAWLHGAVSSVPVAAGRSVDPVPVGVGDDESGVLDGFDSGALVGRTVGSRELEVRVPDSVLGRHCLFTGKSGTGHTAVLGAMVAHQLAEGSDAVLVVDSGGSLFARLHGEFGGDVGRVRFLDLGGGDALPALNVLDPRFLPDRDRCVDAVVSGLRARSDTWGQRVEDILTRSLQAVYEYNCHPDTDRDGMLTLFDLPGILETGVVGAGSAGTVAFTTRQAEVLARVADPAVTGWFATFGRWPAETAAEALAPVVSMLRRVLEVEGAVDLLGRPENELDMRDLLLRGHGLVVSTRPGVLGLPLAVLVGSVLVSAMEDALRAQADLPVASRRRAVVAVDELRHLGGVRWEGLLAEIRKYGCRLLLAAQSVSRLDDLEAGLRDAVLAMCGSLFCHQVSAADAAVLSPEFGGEWVSPNDLVMLDPHCCMAKVALPDRTVPAFRIRVAGV